MASESETVIGVLAEWRDCIESADPSVWNDERIAGLVKATKAQQIAYLDRIEAAWKREKAEAEADALAVGGIVEASRHSPGNAATMREALVQCELFLGNVSRHGHPMLCFGDQCTACNGVDELRGMVVRALSEPARNCDLARDWLQDMYCKFKPPATVRREMPPEWVDAVMAFCKWLLAPAAERKGEN